jgi:hypothetical protein
MVAVSSVAQGAEQAKGQAEVQLCRNGLKERAENPNLPGGWTLIDRNGDKPVLCLYGSLAMVSLESFYQRLPEISALDLVVKTTGGPVDIWLPIGEALKGKVGRLVVDEACFSSCANYLIPLAADVIAGRDTLIVWHGGPSMDSLDMLKGTDVPTAIQYDDLAKRTKHLYDALGIDSSVLQLSAKPPSIVKFRSVFGKDARKFSGYAFSPVRLQQCFRFRNLKNMWHAGDDEAVAKLGKERSSTLAVLENPSPERDGSFKCDK